MLIHIPNVAVPPMGPEPNVGVFIEEHKKRADADPNAPPFDDLRNYAYEGGGSTAGSLSSLASGRYMVLKALAYCNTVTECATETLQMNVRVLNVTGFTI
jgi:hypothetical protein